MEESAVLDIPTEITESTPETPETSSEVESPDTGIENEQPEGLEAAPEGGEPEPLIVGNKLSQKALQTLNELKAKDPKLAAEFKQSLFVASSLKALIPDGIKGVQALKQSIEAVGGVEGIQTLQSENQKWNDLDAQYTGADPAFVEAISEFAPDAFAKLAPSIFEKYASISPDGYAQYVCSTIVADMQAKQIPLALARIADHIGDKPQAVELLNQVIKYVNGLDATGRSTPKPVAGKNAPAPDARAAELDKRETTLRQSEFRTAADSNLKSTFASAWDKATAGLKIDDRQKGAIQELFSSRLLARLKGDPEFDKNVQKFFKAGDREGYNRFIGTAYRDHVSPALRAAIDQIMPARRPGPTPGAPAPRTPPKPAPPPVGNVPTGFASVASRPAAGTIDFQRTSPSMISAGKAILADGKKVQWRK